MKIPDLQHLLDIIYPPRCHICQDFIEGDINKHNWICLKCLHSFKRISSPYCSICRTPFASLSEDNHPCEDCLRHPPAYETLAAPYLYEGEILQAIHQLKYSGKTHLAQSLGSLLYLFAREWLGEKKGFILIPIPLHPKRLRERGFNQSLLLAREVAGQHDLEVDFLSLRRKRYTEPQINLKFHERKKNVKNAFEVREKHNINGRSVILLDDVATTGSTMNECAQTLKRAGCKEVYGLVLARTAGK